MPDLQLRLKLNQFLQWAQLDADGLFKRLDPNLAPRVLLAAFTRKREFGDFALPDWDQLDQAGLTDVRARVAEVPEDLVEAYSNPTTRSSVKYSAAFTKHKLNILEALEFALECATHQSHSYFVGLPVFTEWSFVCPVLRLSKPRCEMYSDLHQGRYKERHMALSFLLAAIGGFLGRCGYSLENPTADGAGPPLHVRVAEFLRDAGAELTARVWRTKWLKVAPEAGLQNSFGSLDEISALAYEGTNPSGRIAMATPGHPNLVPVLEFDEPVPIWQHRRIRKLLELTSRETVLVSDTERVSGMAQVNHGQAEGAKSATGLFFVTFEGRHRWTLSDASKDTRAPEDLMLVVRGIPRLPRTGFDNNEFENRVRDCFSAATQEQIDYLLDLGNEAARGRHGAVMVVSESAAEESERLKGRSTPLRSPIRLKSSLVSALTAIDGALLMDLDANCYAIGAILDGEAEEGQGDPSRGARYNSAVTYAKAKGCLVIFVSQDGEIALLPDS